MEKDYPISAYITNLGKYNEGTLMGEWVSFPTTQTNINSVFNRIQLDGIRYEEYFITDYESTTKGLQTRFSEYTNINELNYLAIKIIELSDYEQRKLESALELYGGNGISDIINLIENLENLELLNSIFTEEDLGYYYIEDLGLYEKNSLGNLVNYIDYERFGRDIRLDEGGYFTQNGYIYEIDNNFSLEYQGIESIPEKFKIC